MPTFYEGAPIAQNTFRLTKEEFIKLYEEEKNNRSFFSKKEVQGAIFLSLILLTVFTVPKSIMLYGTFYTQAVLIVFFLLFFYLSVFWQPEENRKTAAKIYDSNCFLKEESKAVVYRDSLIYENSFEKFSQYLTDFDFCMENDFAYLLSGGERKWLVIKKEGMDEREKENLSNHFLNFYTTKYIRIKQGKK